MLKVLSKKSLLYLLATCFISTIFFLTLFSTPSYGANYCNKGVDPDRCNPKLPNWVQVCRNCDAYPNNEWCNTVNCAVTGKTCLNGACQAPADTIKPVVSAFDVQPRTTTGSVTATYTVTDNIALQTVELWRAGYDIGGCDDSVKTACVWSQIQTRNISGVSQSGNFTDTPSGNAANTYWYGLHVVDNSNNLGNEPTSLGPLKVIVPAAICTENWSCTAWSACSNNSQTRTCTDANHCGTTTNKPNEQQSCFFVKISTPLDGINLSRQGVGTASFAAIAVRGQPPYQYLWHSNLAGDFSTSDQANVNIGNWAVGTHTITFKATDMSSNSATDSIKVNVVPDGSLFANINMQDEYTRSVPAQGDGSVGGGMLISTNVQGGTSPYAFKWNSDKVGDFSTKQSENIDTSTWPLGDHKLTLTVKDVADTVFTTYKNIKIVAMQVNSSPRDGYSIEQMYDLSFFANVYGGVAPYFYEWKSDKDGVFHTVSSSMNTYESFFKDNLSLGWHAITLTVKDSTGLTVTRVVNILIKPLTPITAQITSPANGLSFQQGDDISFTQTYSGGVYPNIYSWRSNKDGLISTSSAFTKNNLSVGNHTITSTVSDSKGNSGSTSINLTITAPAPLNVIISQPANGSSFKAIDQVIGFSATTTGGVKPYSYLWSSNLDGNIGNTDTISKNNLTPGNQVITAQVTDAKNAVKTAMVNLTVTASCATANNLKNSSKYLGKEAFLINDTNWRDVLSLVPVAIWQEGATAKKYPALIYHQESTSFDADSTIHFLQMYSPGHLTTVGSMSTDVNNLLTASQPTGAALNAGSIANINATDYFSYWSSFGSIVVVDYNNYQAGLIASTLASLKNSPIIFVNGANLASYQAVINNKNIFVVDNLDATTQSYINSHAGCQTKYTIDELQKWYAAATQSDKLILVNPNDPNIHLDGYGFTPEKSTQINQAFGGMSLAAPFLAAGRKEIFVFSVLNDPGINNGCSYNPAIAPEIKSTDDLMDNFIKNISNFTALSYLTIVAMPEAIPDSDYTGSCSSGFQFRNTADWMYGSLSDIYLQPKLNTGRIYGITVADASSHINTSLFYDVLINQIYAPSVYTGLSIGHSFDTCETVAQTVTDKAKAAGYNAECFTENSIAGCTQSTVPDAIKYQNRQYITFDDHGDPDQWWGTLGVNNIPWLDLPVAYGAACLTNDFWMGGIQTFGARMLRRGAIGYFGNDGVAWLSNDSLKAMKLFTYEPTTRFATGQVMNYLLYNVNYYWAVIGNPTYTMLLGDPAVVPKFKQFAW